MKVYGDKGKESTMKEAKNFYAKIKCFGETCHESLTQDMKDRALTLLMIMVMQSSSDLKSRG